MARRGRPRKIKLRDKCGRIKKSERDTKPDRIDPTPEMTRHKREVSGQEVGAALSYLDLTGAQKEALTKYFITAHAAGWGSRMKTSSLKDSIAGGTAPIHSDERDKARADEYERARVSLDAEGLFTVQIVERIRLAHNRVELEGRYLAGLRAGADALAVHFKIKRG